MKRFGLALLTLAGVVFAGPYDTWSNFREVTVNTTSAGANVATSVSNFPLLVRLTDVSAASGANVLTGALSANGADVRFTDATGQIALSFEVERWSAGAAEFWVNVPVVAGQTTTKILMFWGKTGQASASSGSAVFDTAAGWRAVYHMNGGTGTTELDATVHGYTMSASDTVPAAVPGDTIGAVGKARMFKGDSTTIAGRQYFVASNTAGSAPLNIGANNPHTISSWVYARGINSSNGSGNSIFNKGDQQYALQIYGNAGSVGVKQWEAAVYTSTWRQAKSKGPAVAGVWTHVTGTWSGGANGTSGTGKFYINGVLDSTSSLAIGTVSAQQAYNLFIGANPNGGGTNAAAPGDKTALARLAGTIQRPRYWDGYIDDITLARGARSDDYVKLTYETQKPGASAVALGVTQAPGALTSLRYVPSNTAAIDTILNLQTGVAVSISPTVMGGPADSIKLDAGATLPAGLTINTTTGVISGIPTAVTAAGNRRIRAFGHAVANDTVSRNLRLSVIAGPTYGFTYSQDSVSYIAGQAYSNSPVYNGRAPTKFSVTPALPTGLVIDSLTGVISGTPSAVIAIASYAVKGTNATDTVNKVIRIAVIAGAGVEDYSTWTGSKQVWLNTQTNGANVTGSVAKFPVLLRLDSLSGFDAMFTQAMAGGADLRITKGTATTTRFPHQIERWDAVAKKAEIWVLIDTVKASTTQSLFVRWGKAGSVNLSYGPAVFDTANGFEAVWHMNATSGNELDATVNGFTANAQAAPTSNVGAVGTARVFNGTTQYFNVPNSVTGRLDFGLDKNYTLSGWANPTAITATTNLGNKIVEKGDNQYTLQAYGTTGSKYWEITTKLNNGTATWAQAASGTTGGTLIGSEIVADSGIGKWNFIVGTYTGTPVGGTMAESLFVNGAPSSYRNETISDLATSRTTTVQVHIGVQSGAAPTGTFTRYWNGALDEVRLQSRARSANWIKLEYANQRPAGQNLIAFTQPTSINSQNGANALVAGGLGLNVKSSTNGVLFNIQGAGTGDKAVLNLVDMWGRTVFSGSFANGGNLVWNGTANNGQNVSAGIYIARVTVVDANNKLRKVLNHKVPFTR